MLQISNRLCLKRPSAMAGSLLTHKLPVHGGAEHPAPRRYALGVDT
ncbi:hypothetical protein [Ktedonobacter racemifer]|nr:hypothetical protein [Ktedonobacter racemifer]